MQNDIMQPGWENIQDENMCKVETPRARFLIVNI